MRAILPAWCYPFQSMAYAYSSLYILLLGPSGVPVSRDSIGITPSTPLIWPSPTAILPYSLLRLFDSSEASLGTAWLSRVPLWTVEWPAMVYDPGTPLTHSPLSCAAILASRWWSPWPNAIRHISGLKTFTYVMADHSPFLELCISRYLNTHQVQFWSGG